MAELDFSDLIPKASTSQVQGSSTGQGVNFDDLIPKQAAIPIKEPEASSVPAAIADIPKELAAAGATGLQHLTGNSVSDLPGYDPRTRGQLGPIEGLMRTGRQIAALPELAYSLVAAPARSLIGHGLADAEHAVGTVIAPEIAAKDNPQQMYETAKGDVDTAMSAMRPAGSPIKVSPGAQTFSGGGQTALPPRGPYEIPANKPAYQWQPAKPVEVPTPSIEELKASATAHYESPEVKNLATKATVVKNFGQASETALANEGFDPEVAPKTFALLKRMQNVPDEAVITGDNFNTLRKVLGKVAQGTDRTEVAAATAAINHLDEALSKVPASEVISGNLPAAASRFEAARGDYAAAMQSQGIDNKLISAELRAASNDSGQNVANTIRQNMRAITDPTKPKEGRGLKPDELAAAQTIVEGTKTQNAMRTAANYLGKMQGTAIGGVVGSVFGPAGAAVGVAAPSTAGFLLKGLANRMTIKQAQRLSEMIRSRAPLASSAQKFEEAAAALQEKTAPQTIAGLVMAARNLSTNLKGAGLDISPSDLFSGVRSGNADDQQRDVNRPP